MCIHSNAGRIVLSLALFFAGTAMLGAQTISLDDAIRLALKNSADLEGAAADIHAAEARALAAKFKFIPGISAFGSYTKLSELEASPLTLKISTPLGEQEMKVDFPASPTQAVSTGLKLQYPIFTGFRLLEAANIADLQTTGKQFASDLILRALRFETTRAYWECLRATANVNMLIKNRDVVKSYQAEVRDQVAQGLATTSDQLAADQRFNAAEISLNDAFIMRNQAYMTLATILGDETSAQKILSDTLTGVGPDEIKLPFELSGDPNTVISQVGLPGADLSAAVATALGARPEAKIAGLTAEISDHAVKAAAGALYPTVTIFGDYTAANPNSRVFPAKDELIGTWNIGAQVSLDIGGIPGTIAQVEAANQDLSKAKAQYRKTVDSITSDVRNSALSLKRNLGDLDLSKAAVSQGEENLRVQSRKFDVGLIKHSELLDAQLSLIRAQFGVINKQIDSLVSWADFQRASGQ